LGGGCQCNVLYCRSCVHQFPSSLCLDCSASFSLSQLVPQPNVDAQITTLGLKCPNNCQDIFPLGKNGNGITNHALICPYQLIRCTFCKATLQRVKNNYHLKNECWAHLEPSTPTSPHTPTHSGRPQAQSVSTNSQPDPGLLVVGSIANVLDLKTIPVKNSDSVYLTCEFFTTLADLYLYPRLIIRIGGSNSADSLEPSLRSILSANTHEEIAQSHPQYRTGGSVFFPSFRAMVKTKDVRYWIDEQEDGQPKAMNRTLLIKNLQEKLKNAQILVSKIDLVNRMTNTKSE